VSNATSGGTPDQILFLASAGVIPPLCRLLSVQDAKVVTVALEGLENILRTASNAGEQVNSRVLTIVSDCGGLSSIEELQVCLYVCMWIVIYLCQSFCYCYCCCINIIIFIIFIIYTNDYLYYVIR